MTFKITYTNGFELIEAKDIFEAAAYMKRRVKITFAHVVSIEEVK